MRWDRLIEEKIRAAQEAGKFDNLRGKGQPLSLDEDPFEDPAWQMANHLLKEQGFRPDWLEDELALREKLNAARQALRRSYEWRAEQQASGRETPAWVEAEWRRALQQFTETIEQINKAIVTFNLKAPLTRFHKRKVVLDEELQKLGIVER